MCTNDVDVKEAVTSKKRVKHHIAIKNALCVINQEIAGSLAVKSKGMVKDIPIRNPIGQVFILKIIKAVPGFLRHKEKSDRQK